ncbi:MAG: hypothetical protein KDK34_16815 [Leptospiraceae bacterium]|nr:hypothetical protein [Leptospiraceae bacterium]
MRNQQKSIRKLSVPALILSLVIPGSLTISCLADIRPEALQSRSTPADADRGRAIVLAGVEAQTGGNGDRRAYFRQGAVRVRLTDQWYGLADALANEWPNSPQEIEFTFIPGKDAGVLKLLDATGNPTGQVWGIHDWNTWRQDNADSQPQYVHSDTIKFMLPTMQYFLEMAYRLPDGGIFDYAGSSTIDGIDCHVVYITWDSYAGNSRSDQYVAYYDQSTGRLYRVDFTVRDSMPFVTASAYYRDYRDVKGYMFPYRIDISNLGDAEDLVHQYIIHSVETNVNFERADYAPDPDRAPASKH